MSIENKCDIRELYDVYNQLIADGFEPIQAFRAVIEEGILDGYACDDCNCGRSEEQ